MSRQARQMLASHDGGSLESELATQELAADCYRLLVASTVDYAVFHLSLDGLIADLEHRRRAHIRFRGSEIIGRHGSVLFTPEDNDFLPKPFTPDQLAGKIKDILAPVMD